MASVYEGSHITLAATAAAHGDAGCIRPFKPSHRFEFKDTTHFVRVMCDENSEAIGLDGNRNVAPLSQRGWAFQESILSRRVLHFGKSQLVWKCASRHTSEDGLMDLFEPDLELSVQFSGTATPVGLRTFLQTRENTERYYIWHRLIEHYSARRFTFLKDKLAALAGIVSIFHLLWEVSNFDKVKRGDADVGVHSWSWAHEDAPIHYPGPDKIAYSSIEIMESVLIFIGEELTSGIADFRLLLRGQVGYVTVGRRDLSRCNSSLLHPVPQSRSIDSPPAGYCHFDFDPYPTGFQLPYLAISKDRAGNSNILILQPKDTTVVTEFSRIGVGKIYGRSEFDVFPSHPTLPELGLNVISLV